MIRKLGSILPVVLTVCLLATSTAQASAKTTVIYTSANFAKGTQRPAGPISGYMAVPVALDGATTLRPAWLPITLRAVHWSSWGGTTATGSGTLYAPTVTYDAPDGAFVTPCASFTSSNVCVLPRGYALPEVGRTTVTAQALLTHNRQQFYDELNIATPPYPLSKRGTRRERGLRVRLGLPVDLHRHRGQLRREHCSWRDHLDCRPKHCVPMTRTVPFSDPYGCMVHP
jgi:hypothetical protein